MMVRESVPRMESFFDTYREFIPDFSLFQESLLRASPTHLRINTLKTDSQSLLRRLRGRGIRLEKSTDAHETLYVAPELASPGNLLEYFLGHIHPQALTSCLASIALAPKRGAYVLDLCAAPGGKSSHMAQLMDHSGLIVANEPYLNRRVPLGNTLDRLGVLNAVVTSYPAQEFPLKHHFDYIMADVPCSGEGIFRRLKEGQTYLENRKKAKLPDLQKKIILRGFDLLKERGEMIYSTCTYNPEENEAVVQFLLARRDAELLPIRTGTDHEPGLAQWRNEKYDEQLERAARIYPHRVDSVGFFMARIGRRG
jgi:NOL1/NOP2/sun family putative RNA methylase